MILLFLLLILWSSEVSAQQPGLSTAKRITQYTVDVWQEEQGLSHNSIVSIAQSADGYLWLATYSDLYRFDGVSFKSYQSALGGAMPRSLFTDAEQTLWIGTTSGLYKRTGSVFSRVPADTILRDRTVHTMVEMHDHSLMLGTSSGIFSFDGTNFRDRSAEFDAVGIAVWTITENSVGEIWVGTEKGVRRKTVSFVEIIDTTSGSLKHNIVRAIIEDRFGSMWIGTGGGGITRYRNGRFSTFTTRDGMPSNVIRTLYEDRTGSVWIGTSGGGLARYLNGRFESLGSMDGLTTDVVWALCQDREGSLWIGTGGGGLNRLRDTRFTALTRREGLGNNFLWTIYGDDRGAQWIGTNGGGVTWWDNGTAKNYTIGTTPLSNIVRTVIDDRRGHIWLGTSDGVFVSPSSAPHRFVRYPGITAKTTYTITQLRDKSLWFGTAESGVFILSAKGLRNVSLPDDISVHCITQHPDGSVWIGTSNGIIVTGVDGAEPWGGRGREYHFADEGVRDIYVDRDTVVWVATDRGGLRRFSHGLVTQYRSAEGYDAQAVHDIEEDDLGNLWLTCNKGIFRVPKEQLTEIARGERMRANFTLYGIVDGMGSSECNGGGQPAGWKMTNGTIWFPTMKGVTIVSPQKLATNPIVPPVYIESILSDNVPTATEANAAVIPAGANRVTINFSALSMLSPDLVHFKYMLEGYDKEWIDGRNERSASYTNIDPGTYRFHVIAANNDGVWNTNGAIISVVVRPHFYETTWFAVLMAVLVGSGAYTAYRMRIDRLKRRQRHLQQLVEERTMNLQQEKERAEQANQFKGELVHIVAHDLKNPLTTIVGMSHFLQQDDFETASVKDSAKAISDSAQQMVDLITDFLNVESMEQGKITLHRVPLSMSELAAYVVSTNRSSVERKQQQVNLVLDPPVTTMVSADHERLYQALENLFSNAVKYSPFNAPIEVRVERIGEEVRFAVKDTGAGLSDEDQKKLFGKFQKLSPRPTGNESSNGLGLSIAKIIVELHGGRIGAESALGRGSTFFITLPAENTTPR